MVVVVFVVVVRIILDALGTWLFLENHFVLPLEKKRMNKTQSPSTSNSLELDCLDSQIKKMLVHENFQGCVDIGMGWGGSGVFMSVFHTAASLLNL